MRSRAKLYSLLLSTALLIGCRVESKPKNTALDRYIVDVAAVCRVTTDPNQELSITSYIKGKGTSSTEDDTTVYRLEDDAQILAEASTDHPKFAQEGGVLTCTFGPAVD